MNNKPIICITASKSDNLFNLRSHYTSAMREMGAVPVILPYINDPDIIKAYCEMADGVLFSGGIDIDPKYYNETPVNDSVDICPDRDTFEFALFEEYYKTGKPILGICRGMQFMNVALGGNLFQDIPGHKQTGNRWDTPYKANVVADSVLGKIVSQDVLSVNSFHHQAVKDVAPTLRAVAFDCNDNGIEAVETTENRFLVGVQWHPEDFYREDESAQRLFKAFIEEARKNRQGK